MEIGERNLVDASLMVVGDNSIYVETFERVINGTRYEFTRSTESRGNGRTITRTAAWVGLGVEPIHEFG